MRILILVILLLWAVVPEPVMAQESVRSAARVPLPFDLVDVLDGVKFKIRVPANWNGTLLVYMQGDKIAAPPPEPSLVPPVVRGSTPPLEATLLARGYALAASEVGTMDMQLKEEVQDSFALATYYRGRVGDPKRIVLWGTSFGGLDAARMVEDYPRSFDGAISMCGPNVGISRRIDYALDFALAYAVVFGWPEAWGPLEDLREGLNFNQEVVPRIVLPDATNRGKWEFIRLVMRIQPEPFWQTDPLFGAPGMFMNMFGATGLREGLEAAASGPVAQNQDRRYALKPEEKTYLAGMGVNADDLLGKMNARANIQANPRARDYVQRFGDVRGMPRKPLLTLHNTLDGAADVRSERFYRDAVIESGSTQYLFQTYVTGIGHCAFTAKQLLAVLSAMESWLDTGMKPDASFFPETDGFDNSFVPAPWPY